MLPTADTDSCASLQIAKSQAMSGAFKASRGFGIQTLQVLTMCRLIPYC
jgi:hypothetical protein